MASAAPTLTTARGVAARLHDVRKTYIMGSQEVHALAGVSADFEIGSFWAILGASGSGKSTMLNLLGCLDRPTSGRYVLDGHDVSQLDDDELSEMRLRSLGFIFQSFNLIPQSTVEENIHLPLYYLGWEPEPSKRRARELAKRVGLEDRLNHRPMELSGGQQQRVAIARALVTRPLLILADEPTGALDTRTSLELMVLFQDLNRQGMTVVVVTHESDIARFAARLLRFRDGHLVEDLQQAPVDAAKLLAAEALPA